MSFDIWKSIDRFFGGGEARADDRLEDNRKLWESLGSLDPKDLAAKLDGYVQQGVISPEQAQEFLQGPSAMEGVSTDPRLAEAQNRALSSLQEIGEDGGMTAQDRANLARISTEEAVRARGNQDAIRENAQARGAGGSGLELLQSMQNQQSNANRASQRDLDVAGMAQNRALQALQQGGALAGNIRGQEFGEGAQKAQAEDAISRFNAQTKGNVDQVNVAARNQAAINNLAAKQAAANSQVDAANKTAQNAVDARLAARADEVGLVKGRAGVNSQDAQNEIDKAAQKKKLFGDTLTAAATASDERLKTDIEPFTAAEFLDGLNAYKYRYKDGNGLPDGPQIGVMAQDMERMFPDAVREIDGKKYIEYDKLQGPILASLVDMHARLKALEKGEK